MLLPAQGHQTWPANDRRLGGECPVGGTDPEIPLILAFQSLERWENTPLILYKLPGLWYWIMAVIGNQDARMHLTVYQTVLHAVNSVTNLPVSLWVQDHHHITRISASECLHQRSLPPRHSLHRYTNSSHPHWARSIVHIPCSIRLYLTTHMYP